jgi:hypothetical protein
MWHPREMGVFALYAVLFLLAHPMRNIESKIVKKRR